MLKFFIFLKKLKIYENPQQSYSLLYFGVKKSINIGKIPALIKSSIGAHFLELNILRAYFKQFNFLTDDV